MTASAPVAPPRWPADATLLREVLTWARAEGWAGRYDKSVRTHRWTHPLELREVWVDRGEPGDDGVRMLVIYAPGQPEFWVHSVVTSVDLIVALGVLPSTFSSAYREGVEAVEEASLETRLDVYLDELWGRLKDSDVLAEIGRELDGVLDREPFVRRRQVQRVVDVVLNAAGVGDDA